LYADAVKTTPTEIIYGPQNEDIRLGPDVLNATIISKNIPDIMIIIKITNRMAKI
jgi:hypothetical protein